MLKIHNSLACSRHLADERHAHLAVPANLLRLIQIALLGKGNLDGISGGEPYRCFRARRIRQRRLRGLTSAAGQRGKNQESGEARRGSQRACATSSLCIRQLPIVTHLSSILRHTTLVYSTKLLIGKVNLGGSFRRERRYLNRSFSPVGFCSAVRTECSSRNLSSRSTPSIAAPLRDVLSIV